MGQFYCHRNGGTLFFSLSSSPRPRLVLRDLAYRYFLIIEVYLSDEDGYK